MTGINMLILGASFLSLLLVGRFNGPKAWVQALYERPAISLLLIVALGSTFLGGSRETSITSSETQLIDSVRVIRIIVLSILFIISSTSILRTLRTLSMAGTGAVLMLFYGLYAMLSTVYSPDPLLTLWKGFEVVTMVLTIISVSSKVEVLDDLEWLVNLLLAFLLFLVITLLAGAVIDPANAFRELYEGDNAAGAIGQRTGTIPILRGLMPGLSPAAAGGIAGYTAIAAFLGLLKKDKRTKLGFMIVMGMSLTSIILIHSRTGVFALASAIVVILILKRKTLYALLLGLPVGIVTILTSLGDLITTYIYRGQSEEEFATLSGRTEFWTIVFEKFQESPIIGYGYYASHRTIFGLGGVDNTYLSVALSLGMIGLTIFISTLVVAALTLIRNWPSKLSSGTYSELWMLIIGLSIITFIRSTVGTSFETFYYMLFVYMMLQVSISSLARLRNISITSATKELPDSPDSPDSPKNTIISAKPRQILSVRKTNRH